MVSEISLPKFNFFLKNLDINECSLKSYNCDQICTNTIGSYYCSCYTGFNLSASGHDCFGEHEIFINVIVDNRYQWVWRK